jgi:ribosomal protein S18 acetylase RimI-like enzyme
MNLTAPTALSKLGPLSVIMANLNPSTLRTMLREATREDIPILVEVMEEFYAESNFSLDHAEADAAFRVLLDQPFCGAIWLSNDQYGVTGYVILTVTFAMEFGGLVGSIDDLYVRPNARRKGFANELLQSLLIECDDRGLKALHVEVAPENEAAQALYQNFGLQKRTDKRDHLSMLLKGDF